MAYGRVEIVPTPKRRGSHIGIRTYGGVTERHTIPADGGEATVEFVASAFDRRTNVQPTPVTDGLGLAAARQETQAPDPAGESPIPGAEEAQLQPEVSEQVTEAEVDEGAMTIRGSMLPVAPVGSRR